VAHLGLLAGGSVWLLPGDAQPLDLDRALPALRRLDELLQCDGETSQEVAPWLDGDAPLPVDLGAGPWRLARVESAGESSAALLRRTRSGFAVTHAGATYVVLTARETLEVADARVVVSEATLDLVAARRQVDAALPLVPVGTACSVSDVRAAAVVRHLGESLADLPDLGRDPLAALLEHDAQRGTCFTEALAAWLDAGCDVVRATEGLGWHGNTMRYRLRRAFDLLGTDFRDDPDARLAVHVQLRANRGTTARS
jgi:DNA-binding PucR family transcriptional regulator